MSELLPCPFCGGKAKLEYNGNDYVIYRYIECEQCHVKTPPMLGNHDGKDTVIREQVIAHWNTRHQPEVNDVALAIMKEKKDE